MLFIIASVRVFQFGINNPDLSVWDVKIGQLFWIGTFILFAVYSCFNNLSLSLTIHLMLCYSMYSFDIEKPPMADFVLP